MAKIKVEAWKNHPKRFESQFNNAFGNFEILIC
jgi:hypothetical protein